MTTSQQIVPKLDPFGGVALVVGSILGSGIFIAPRLIASFSGSLWVAALFWIVGGLVCTAGALIYGGLGLLYPQGGGQYVYLRESMGGRYAGFYGWVSMLVICPTMLAGTSLFFTELCAGVAPSIAPIAKVIAVSLIVLFTLFNTLGLKLAGSIQKLLVIAHVALFVGVMALSFFYLPGHELASYAHAPLFSGFDLGKGVLALAAVLWSFEGFNTVTFLTNEIEGGEKNVRRIALWGCGIVMILYLAFNLIALANISHGEILRQANAAGYLMTSVYGARAAWIVFALTALGVATVLHSSIIIGPRVIVATVNDGSTLRSLGTINEKSGVPSGALWFQCAVASVYVLVGHFDVLITAFIVLNWLFYGLTALGYLKIKMRIPASLPRRAADVACVLVFASMVVALLVSQFIENTQIAFLGIVCFIIGVYVPAPTLLQNRKKRLAREPVHFSLPAFTVE